MIEFSSSDIFATDCEALVNTVNCVAAMGKGIALGVKTRWPRVYADYRTACGCNLGCDGRPDRRFGPLREQRAPTCCEPRSDCTVHRVRPGSVSVRPTGTAGVRAIVEVPTKRHWMQPSLLSDVEAGIPALAEAIAAHGIASIAIPPLGCGNGGLSWTTVGPLVVAGLRHLDARIVLHAAPV